MNAKHNAKQNTKHKLLEKDLVPKSTCSNKRLLSIDVGIQNLAICILASRNNAFKVDIWSVLSVCAQPKCQGFTKTGTPCTRKAICLFQEVNGVDKSTCKAHAKSHSWTPIPIMNSKTLLEQELVLRLLKIMDGIHAEHKVDAVVIERQPIRSRKMMLAADTIFAFWAPLAKVSFVAPVAKFSQIWDSPHVVVAKGKRGYKDRKQQSIDVLTQVCSKLNMTLPESNKMDDLADAFLQGLYHMCRSKI
jgi:hypothetical protein